MMNTDLIKAYRRARKTTGLNPYLDGGVAERALTKARGALQKVEFAEKRYRDEATTREALDASAANGAPIGRDRLQAATMAEVKARSAFADEKLRAGLFDSDGPPRIWSPVSYDPESSLAHLSDDDGGGAFRNVRDAHDVTCLGHTGWHTDPYGDVFKDETGLCIGVVAQMRGRDRRAVYVAGYRFGGTDVGPTFDLSETYDDDDDAARAADSLAEHAAKREREYQSAWQAGSRYADAGDTLATIRSDLLTSLRELRAAGGCNGEMPATESMIRVQVAAKLDERREAMEERARLVEGDESPLCFYSGDERLRDAFCEGAGLSRFPK